jgi:enolase
MSVIKKIIANEVINSLGFPTLQGKLILDNGRELITTVSSSDPDNTFQNKELRDNDEDRYNGFGVSRAVSYINELIGPKLVGVSPLKQLEIDSWLVKSDPNKDKSQLGVNTTLVVSQLLAKAGALESQMPLFKYLNTLYQKATSKIISLQKLPTPLFTIIIGGLEGQIDLDFKEFMVIPSSSLSYSKSYQTGVDLYHLIRKFFKMNFVVNLDVIQAIKETIEDDIGLRLGRDIFLGVNFNASGFFKNNLYSVKDRQQPLKTDDFISFIINLVKKYSPLVIIDPLENQDFANWKKLSQMFGKDIYLVGEDFTSSNVERINRAVKEQSLTTVALKLNQIGTITETLTLINFLRESSLSYIIASGYGETNDDFISDFSVAVQSDFVKFGPPVHGENITKYNRLLDIEKELKLG